MTHPFHPWAGLSFEFVAVRRTWQQDRVFFVLGDGTLTSVPTAWTDAAEPDVFATISAGRSAFRVEDLLALANLVRELGLASRPRRRVRGTSPVV